ncbi:GGDEF domain-containing protein [Bacillus sp. J33]|uniref:GGDEF domain-containing protein n=1 Tax=Bacillus sp. J33 TaxID=935836 RepID=UPI00047C6966|nr:GGDEF domain-containing protein [Bacillus sp. J33]
MYAGDSQKERMAGCQFTKTEMMNGFLPILDTFMAVLIGAQGELLKYNEPFRQFLNKGPFLPYKQHFIEDIFYELRDQQVSNAIFSAVDQHGQWAGRLQIISGDTDKSTAYVQIARIKEDKGPNYFLLGFEADLKSSEEDIWKKLAYTDELTGLSNWRKFREQLSAAKRESDFLQKPFGLLFIDIDHFKEINDEYGHLAGDHFLKLCADIIKESLGEHMHAFRKSGDEFLVIIKERTQIEHTSNLIRSRLTGEFLIGSSLKSVSVSIGASIYPACGHDEDSIIHQADLSMYEEKMRRNKRGVRSGD